MKNLHLLSMNLQMFAADLGANGGGSDATENQKDQNTDQNTQNENGSTDDDPDDKSWKPDKHARAWLAAEISKQKNQWEKSIDEKAKNAVTEAQRLATLTDEEKAKEAEAKRLADLEAREKSIMTKELRAETSKQLSDAGLPASFLDMAFADKAETIKSNIEAIKETFDKSVEDAVNERIKTKQTKVGSSSNDTSDPFELAMKRKYGK